MPYPRPEQYGNVSNDKIVYPVEHMREAAAKILAQASNAQAQHDSTWQHIQSFVQQNFDPTMVGTILACLQPYADRLRATYNWQIDFASALFTTIDAITSTDDALAQSFQPQRSERYR